jgi:hypothetical protein
LGAEIGGFSWRFCYASSPHASKIIKFQRRNLKKIWVNLKRVLLIELILLRFFLIPFVVVKIIMNSNIV